MKITVTNANEIVNKFIKRISCLPEWEGMESIEIGTRNGFDEYLIHAAAIMGELEVVAALLSLGENIDQEGEYEHTPLLEALQQENYKIAVFLLMNGADFKKTNDVGTDGWEMLGFTLKNIKIID
jgi:hypothetical protein